MVCVILPPKQPFSLVTKQIKNILFLIVSTLLGILLMVWIYRGFNFRDLYEVFCIRHNYIWITLTLIAGIAANVLRSLRWQMLLESAEIHIKKRRAIELVFISYLINSVTPRLGELTRSLLVRRGDAEVSTRAFGTVIIEKLADVVCLIVVVAIAVAFRWDDTLELVHRFIDGMRQAVPSYTLYIIIGLLICIAISFTLPKLKHIRTLLFNFWQGITAISRLKNPKGFIGFCIGIWACNFLQLWLIIPCYEALGSIGPMDAFHIFAMAGIGLLLPTPGGVGPWHFAVVKTLTTAHAVPAAIAKSFALVTHGLKTVLVMLLGILAYITYYWEVATHWHRNRSQAGTSHKV